VTAASPGCRRSGRPGGRRSAAARPAPRPPWPPRPGSGVRRARRRAARQPSRAAGEGDGGRVDGRVLTAYPGGRRGLASSRCKPRASTSPIRRRSTASSCARRRSSSRASASAWASGSSTGSTSATRASPVRSVLTRTDGGTTGGSTGTVNRGGALPRSEHGGALKDSLTSVSNTCSKIRRWASRDKACGRRRTGVHAAWAAEVGGVSGRSSRARTGCPGRPLDRAQRAVAEPRPDLVRAVAPGSDTLAGCGAALAIRSKALLPAPPRPRTTTRSMPGSLRTRRTSCRREVHGCGSPGSAATA
jgi:hypothetical protein